MTISLHLGVLEFPYSFMVDKKTRRIALRIARGDGRDKIYKAITAAPSGGETTGDVAQILEDQYHVMETFYEMHEDAIVHALEDSLHGVIENLEAGGPAPQNPMAGAGSAIEGMFRDFIDQSEVLQKLGAGPGTAAARKGVNHRLLHPYAKANPSRPPFKDTGLYQSAFKAWVGDE